MSRDGVYYWAPSEGAGFQDAIALSQNVAIGDNLVLIANTPNNIFSYINTLNLNTTTAGVSSDVIRSINITSDDDTDNSTVTFIISGIGTPVDGLGNPTQVIGPISEDVTGPGPGATSTSANIYSVIESITATEDNATGVYVGYGPNGITNYYRYDYDRNTAAIYATSYTLQFIDNMSLMSGVYASLNRPEYPSNFGGLVSFGIINNQSVAFIPAIEYTAPTNSFVYNSIYGSVAVIWATITGTSTDSMYFTIIQQGIT